MRIEKEIRKFCDKPVFFAGIHYGEPLPFSTTMHAIGDAVVLVSGIANPKHSLSLLTELKVIKHFDFNDHHKYSAHDVKVIVDYAKKNSACIVTTEKDAVKIDQKEFQVLLGDSHCYYVPIETEFIKVEGILMR